MNMATSITSFSRTLLANENWTINQTGTVVRGIAGTAAYTVEPEGMNPLVGFGTGLSVTFGPFQRVIITNGATAQTVTLWIGDGIIDDSRLVGNVDITGGIKISGNPSVVGAAVAVLVTATQIVAADSDRSSCLVVNNGANLMYVGPTSGVTAVNGIPVAAGASFDFTGETSLYGISIGGTNDIRTLDEATS